MRAVHGGSNASSLFIFRRRIWRRCLSRGVIGTIRFFKGNIWGTGFWESGGETLAGCIVRKSGDGLPPLQAKAAIILWPRGQTTLDPKTDSPLQSGDTLILTGDSAAIKEARVQLASED